MKLRYLWPAVGALVAALSACGGGGGGDDMGAGEPQQPSPGGGSSSGGTSGAIPSSAMASSTAFTAYLASLPPDDSGEPFSVSGLKPPLSNTAEAVDIR